MRKKPNFNVVVWSKCPLNRQERRIRRVTVDDVFSALYLAPISPEAQQSSACAIARVYPLVNSLIDSHLYSPELNNEPLEREDVLAVKLLDDIILPALRKNGMLASIPNANVCDMTRLLYEAFGGKTKMVYEVLTERNR